MSKKESDNSTIALHEFLNAERILFLRGKQTKNEVFEALIKALCKEDEEAFAEDVSWGIFHREDLMNTAVGNGIAVPHALMPDLDKCRLAIALCPDGISDYQVPDNIPLRMVIMLLSPEEEGSLHLQVIASIGNRFYDGRLKSAFLASDTPQNCLDILSRAES